MAQSGERGVSFGVTCIVVLICGGTFHSAAIVVGEVKSLEGGGESSFFFFSFAFLTFFIGILNRRQLLRDTSYYRSTNVQRQG